jgi:hemerythrin-like domain-containing protein
MRRKKHISMNDIKTFHRLNQSLSENVKDIIVEVTKKAIEKKLKNYSSKNFI